MKNRNKMIIIILIIFILCGLFLSNGFKINNTSNKEYNITEFKDKLSIDMSKWNYDEENDIYYQIGLVYCTNPENTEYESLAIYVPGKYFNAEKNNDSTYTCSINKENNVGNYSADNAPFVMPINTAGYSSMKAPTKYSSNEVSDYTNNGLIYVSAGCRGKENGDTYNGGAPWGVTDLKAAIRYLRFNNEILPGNTENIFTFGHSGGGAQSALMGTTGDSELYIPYLESIGAAMVDENSNSISDSVAGSMCWCPITSLDYADEAYEWNMGQYSNSGSRNNSTWTSKLSKDLAIKYGDYINKLNLKDSDGNILKLEESENGIYNSGSYYDYMLSVIEESLNNFLNDTEFPYSPGNDMNQDSPGGNVPMDNFNDESSKDAMPSGQMPSDSMSDMKQDLNNEFTNIDSGSYENVTYNTPEDYVNSLNDEIEWVTYDSNTNTAKVKNIEGFIKTCKNPSKDVAAFDDLNRKQAENDLFGNNESDYLHFDNNIKDLMQENENKYSEFEDYNNSFIEDYNNDLNNVDVMNNTIETRVNMYNPMYYLCDYYDGKGSSTIAKYWRIHSGIEQSDTALTIETNLVLALNQTSSVESVEFETVWNQGHTTAERTGDSTSNFINWINECLN